MKNKFLLVFFFLTSLNGVLAQTYTGTGGVIPDNNTPTDFPINVSGLSPAILDANHGMVSVCINLTHTWDADLDFQLIAPGGMTIPIVSGVGGDGDNFTNTCFDMNAPVSILAGSAPFTGTFIPTGYFGNFNNGQNGNGIWILRITDMWGQDQGDLIDWSITFGNNPPVPFAFTDSNLPLIIINTNGQSILNDPRIVADMGIIDNGPGIRNALTDPYNNYNGKIAIETRGSSSQGFPKKSYAIETQDLGGNNLNVPLLGMPSENDWILYAPYTDKTLMRDAMAYQLGRDMGRYAPRFVFAELFINGQYMGVYCLEEKIKRDNNRVDVATLNYGDTLGDELTGGYILKIDRTDGPGSYFTSDYPGNFGNINYVYVDPEGVELHPLQQNYIQNYVGAFEDALYGSNFMDPVNGYRRYADVGSFIDFFLVNELSNNVDGYRLSTFLYKDKNSVDSLIHMGPLWDFNLTFGNADYCGGQYDTGWSYVNSGNCGDVSFWWGKLLQDSTYVRQLRCRYDELRLGVFSENSLHQFIDSLAAYLDESQQRNYQMWPILGTYIWPNPIVWNTYQEEIDYMKDWISGRLQWLDANIPGSCPNLSTIDLNTENKIKLYPNPVSGDELFFESNMAFEEYLVIDAAGRIIMNGPLTSNSNNLNVSFLSPGIYVLTLSVDGKMVRSKFIRTSTY